MSLLKLLWWKGDENMSLMDILVAIMATLSIGSVVWIQWLERKSDKGEK